MKVTKGLIDKLIALRDGDSLPASGLKGEWVDELIRDGILVSSSRGSRRSVTAVDGESFSKAVARINERFADLEKTRELLMDEGTSGDALRASQASNSGNSKFRKRRSFPGFLVNTYEVIEAQLNGKSYDILPEEGSSVFVSRYPQSSDLRNWLIGISNPYVHFGDFDLAGIKIFLSEFHKYLLGRSSYLIPSDIEERLKNGSTERFQGNYYENRHLTSDIPELQTLINTILKHHKGYDQEGYIQY